MYREPGPFCSSFLQAVQNYCKYVTTEAKTVSPVLPNVSVGAAFLGVDILRALLLISLSCGGMFRAARYGSL